MGYAVFIALFALLAIFCYYKYMITTEVEEEHTAQIWWYRAIASLILLGVVTILFGASVV